MCSVLQAFLHVLVQIRMHVSCLYSNLYLTCTCHQLVRILAFSTDTSDIVALSARVHSLVFPFAVIFLFVHDFSCQLSHFVVINLM